MMEFFKSVLCHTVGHRQTEKREERVEATENIFDMMPGAELIPVAAERSAEKAPAKTFSVGRASA